MRPRIPFIVVMAVGCIALVAAAMAGSLMSSPTHGQAAKVAPSASAGQSEPVELATYLLPASRAPRLELTDQDARPYSLRTAR